MPRLLLAFLLTLLSTSAFAASGFGTIWHDGMTVFFIVVNLFLTGYFVFYRFNRFAVQHGPEVLTTVGIFGCFLGIAVALLKFDAGHVSTSVPELLEGVKTAFWASVSGVFGSLAIRCRHHFQKTPIQQSDGAPKSANLDDVVGALHSLHKGLSGNEEGSLLSQLKLMRTDQSDQLQKMRASFETFAEKMVENNSKALIEALEGVIRDFNTKISEQFGENFKLLNAAVEKLVIWQQQYKEELDILQGVQRSSAEDLRKSAAGLSVVAERAEAYTETAAALETLLHGLAQQYKLIEHSQQSLATVLVEMKYVAPQFASKLDELANSMQLGVARVQGDVSEIVRNFGSLTQSSSAEMKQLLTDTIKKSQKEVNDELLRSLDTIRQGVITLDKGLNEELTKSLETLGRQLASLSEKFVADYSPLTDRLREVVRLAGSV